jgi:ubiquitin-like 1-activating enzyme E1 A
VDIITASFANLFEDNTIFALFTLVIATDMPLMNQQTINAACRMQGRPFYAASTVGMYGYIFADLITHDFVISRQKGNVATKIGPESPTRSIVAATINKDSDGKVTELVTKREIYSPIQLANSSPLPEWHLSSRRRKLNVSPILSCLRALWDYQNQTGLAMPSQTHEDLALFTTLATAKHKELQLPPETLNSGVLRMFLAGLGSEISPVCAFLGGRLAQDAINVIGGKEQPIQNLLVFDGEESKAPIYAFSSELFLGLQNAPPLQAMAPVMGNGVGEMPLVGDPTLVGPPMMAGDGAGLPGTGLNGGGM